MEALKALYMELDGFLENFDWKALNEGLPPIIHENLGKVEKA